MKSLTKSTATTMVRSFDGPSKANDEKKSGSPLVAMSIMATVFFAGGHFQLQSRLKKIMLGSRGLKGGSSVVEPS